MIPKYSEESPDLSSILSLVNQLDQKYTQVGYNGKARLGFA